MPKLTAQDGAIWHFEEDLGAAFEGIPLGAKVPMFYDPAAPARHVVGAGISLRRVLGVGFVSLPFLLSGIWILFG